MSKAITWVVMVVCTTLAYATVHACTGIAINAADGTKLLARTIEKKRRQFT